MLTLPFSMLRLARPPAAAANRSSLSELLLDREWMLPNAAAEINKISLSKSENAACPLLDQFSYSNNSRPTLGAAHDPSSFYIVRDDLLHPLINGNKARKLDALLPLLQRHSATDVVTCGGCQSAHAAALAVACTERGIRPHLLLTGERPEVSTGYNLVSVMYGNTTYVTRTLYAQREEMLRKHAKLVAGAGGFVVGVDGIIGQVLDKQAGSSNGDTSGLPWVEAGKGQKKVVVVNEGAADVTGLLGVVRLLEHLSKCHLFGTEQHINFVVDAGTGTTAIGLALGAICSGLPWKVTAIMLADSIENYKKREKSLISDFKRIFNSDFCGQTSDGVDDSIVCWVERLHPRKFGKVLKGEVDLCRKIAKQTGILLDPVYTLAAWEQAVLSLTEVKEEAKVVMLHTGGTLGLFGLAQRYPLHFNNTEQVIGSF